MANTCLENHLGSLHWNRIWSLPNSQKLNIRSLKWFYPSLLQHKDFPTSCLSKTGQFPIYKGKKECQAALLRWPKYQTWPCIRLLVADLYLLIYCSTPLCGEVKKNRENWETLQKLMFRTRTSHSLCSFIHVAGKKPISIQSTSNIKGYLYLLTRQSPSFFHFKDEDIETDLSKIN